MVVKQRLLHLAYSETTDTKRSTTAYSLVHQSHVFVDDVSHFFVTLEIILETHLL
jgi:hypothetical protein